MTALAGRAHGKVTWIRPPFFFCFHTKAHVVWECGTSIHGSMDAPWSFSPHPVQLFFPFICDPELARARSPVSLGLRWGSTPLLLHLHARTHAHGSLHYIFQEKSTTSPPSSPACAFFAARGDFGLTERNKDDAPPSDSYASSFRTRLCPCTCRAAAALCSLGIHA